MTRADDYILELLRDVDIAANPTTIAFNIDYTGAYVANRCQVMAKDEYGLVRRLDEKQAIYEITELGVRYLDDELTDEEEQRLESID